MKNIDMEALKKAVEANKKMLEMLRTNPKVIDLGKKMQLMAFNLDKAGIKASKEDYWGDMAVIAAYCITAQMVEIQNGKTFDPPAANDNEDMKMAA